MVHKQKSGIKCLRDCEFFKLDFSRVLLMLQLQNFTTVVFFFLFNVMGKILRKPWGQIPVLTQLVSRAVK